MKTALLALTSVFALSSFASAASYAINNGSGATASGVVDSFGRAFRSGTVAGDAFTGASGGVSAGPGVVSVGIFSTDSLSTVSSSAQLISLFTNFGGVTNTFAAAGATGNRGVFSLSTSLLVEGSQFAGKNMYFFAGNGTTLANSTEFLVFKSNTLFNVADDSSPTAVSVTFRPDQGTLLFGLSLGDVKTASTDASVTAGWQLVAIPEPSAALLGVFGALGLLRRRRR
jgi:hypothetical protein